MFIVTEYAALNHIPLATEQYIIFLFASAQMSNPGP